MAEPAETTQETPARIGAVEGKPDVTLVTSENFDAFVTQQLGPPAGVTTDENPDPEAEAAAALAELEAKKAADKAAAEQPREGDEKDGKVFFKGKFVGKHDFAYRLHVKTQETEAAAAEKVAKAAKDAEDARAEAAKAAKERDELKAKYEPPKSTEIGPEPQPAQFTDMAEYAKALKEWAGQKALNEAKAARDTEQAAKDREAATKSWNARLKAAQDALPDYAEKVEASSVKVSDEMRDAIIESEVGPQILYHFAEHPEAAEAMGKLSIKAMLKEFGKLEDKIGSAGKPQGKSGNGAAGAATVAEISKAPAPISPLKGANSPPGLKFDAAGNWLGTPEEWRAARLAGKIK
jgi:colicin import membrane protein